MLQQIAAAVLGYFEFWRLNKSAIAVKKLLRSPEWGFVQFLGAFDKLKLPAKLTVQGVGVIPHYIKSTAFSRALGSERAHNHMAAGPHCSHRKPDISPSLFRCDQEVKHGAIVPHVEVMGRQVRLRDISANPMNPSPGFPKPCFRYIQGSLRDI